MRLFKRIAHKIPAIPLKLKQAGMDVKPEQFVKKTVFSAFFMTTGILIIFVAFFSKSQIIFRLLALLAPFIFIMMFFYFLRLPDIKASRIKREINKEIIDAGHFILVEIESGVPLYTSFKSVGKNFQHIGKYFREIVDNVDLGASIEESIVEAIEYTPSRDFRRVLWQIINSLKTGSDIATSLKEILEQISREHLIEIRRYGRKLNPLAMFYMIIAVIIPSLGITIMVVLSSFISLNIELTVLIILALFLGFIQFMFLALIKSSRPAVNM